MVSVSKQTIDNFKNQSAGSCIKALATCLFQAAGGLTQATPTANNLDADPIIYHFDQLG